MARQKTFRKKDFFGFPFCFGEDKSWKGRWKDFFGNDKPIVLEVGCGKGEMVRGLAMIRPNHNYVGLDLKSDRMWVGARIVEREKLKNVAFQRLDILRLAEYFGMGEVDEIWITFPDPFPKKKNTGRRLTNLRYFRNYVSVLKPGGSVHFKTDNEALFRWTLDHLMEIGVPPEVFTFDLHSDESVLPGPERNILTRYETRFQQQGKSTKYLRCCPAFAAISLATGSITGSINLSDYKEGS